MRKVFLTISFFNLCFFTYSQKQTFTFGDITNIDSLQIIRTNEKAFIVSTIINKQIEDAKTIKKNVNYLGYLNLLFHNIHYQQGVLGTYVQSDKFFSDSVALKKIQSFYNVNSNCFLILDVNSLMVGRSTAIESTYLRKNPLDVCNNNLNLYNEINIPLEGWEVLDYNNLNLFFTTRKLINSHYTNLFIKYYSNNIIIPVYQWCYDNKKNLEIQKRLLYKFIIATGQNTISIEYKGVSEF